MHSKFNIVRLFLFTIYFFILSVQCKKENEISDDTYFGGKLIILGHRGMGAYYKKPGNTYESIDPAINIGVDGCEVDVQITKDTVLVLMHDHLLNALTTCNGRVYETTWNELKECEYHSIDNNVFVYSVDEVFSRIGNLNNLYFSFDSKLDDETEDYILFQKQLLRAIKRICDKYNMSNNIFIEGNEQYLLLARSLGLTNKLFLSGILNETNIQIAKNDSFFGICSAMNSIEINTDIAHENGLYVMIYTPNNYYSNLIAVDNKIDILQTDDPISLLKLFDRFNYDYVIP